MPSNLSSFPLELQMIGAECSATSQAVLSRWRSEPFSLPGWQQRRVDVKQFNPQHMHVHALRAASSRHVRCILKPSSMVTQIHFLSLNPCHGVAAWAIRSIPWGTCSAKCTSCVVWAAWVFCCACCATSAPCGAISTANTGSFLRKPCHTRASAATTT